MTSRTLVLALGNPLRGDDGAGPAVAARLQADPPPGVEVACSRGDVAEILEALERFPRVIAVDASEGRGAAGRIRRFDAHASPLPAGFDDGSTHGLGLAAALELLRVRHRLPGRVSVYAIEGRAFGFGAGLTPEVADAVAAVEARIREELAAPP